MASADETSAGEPFPTFGAPIERTDSEYECELMIEALTKELTAVKVRTSQSFYKFNMSELLLFLNYRISWRSLLIIWTENVTCKSSQIGMISTGGPVTCLLQPLLPPGHLIISTVGHPHWKATLIYRLQL